MFQDETRHALSNTASQNWTHINMICSRQPKLQ